VGRSAEVQLALATGQDFTAVAKKYSEALDGPSGGDAGWVFKYQLSPDLQDAIWQAPVGGTTRVVVDSSGWYIYKILAEETLPLLAKKMPSIPIAAHNFITGVNKRNKGFIQYNSGYFGISKIEKA
jgi:hypothetical protein